MFHPILTFAAVGWVAVCLAAAMLQSGCGDRALAPTSASKLTREPFTSRTTTVEVGARQLSVYVAETPEQHSVGLQGVARLGSDEGMLFGWPQPSWPEFVIKSVPYALDIIWVGPDSRVVGVSMIAPPGTEGVAEMASSPEAVRWVIEVNAGWATRHGIAAGDRVVLPAKLR